MPHEENNLQDLAEHHVQLNLVIFSLERPSQQFRFFIYQFTVFPFTDFKFTKNFSTSDSNIP